VFTNSLKGVVVRTEKDMGLRRDVSPQQILARQPKADPLGVQRFQP
jgi:tRNA-2-methylthio-N6-dimethylallyladenosine synthase